MVSDETLGHLRQLGGAGVNSLHNGLPSVALIDLLGFSHHLIRSHLQKKDNQQPRLPS